MLDFSPDRLFTGGLNDTGFFELSTPVERDSINFAQVKADIKYTMPRKKARLRNLKNKRRKLTDHDVGTEGGDGGNDGDIVGS